MEEVTGPTGKSGPGVRAHGSQQEQQRGQSRGEETLDSSQAAGRGRLGRELGNLEWFWTKQQALDSYMLQFG